MYRDPSIYLYTSTVYDSSSSSPASLSIVTTCSSFSSSFCCHSVADTEATSPAGNEKPTPARARHAPSQQPPELLVGDKKREKDLSLSLFILSGWFILSFAVRCLSFILILLMRTSYVSLERAPPSLVVLFPFLSWFSLYFLFFFFFSVTEKKKSACWSGREELPSRSTLFLDFHRLKATWNWKKRMCFWWSVFVAAFLLLLPTIFSNVFECL